jgi:plastocyanin
MLSIRKLMVFAIVVGLTLSQAGALIHPAHGSAFNINIQNFAFNPQNVTINTGDSVTWTNNDPVIYTLWFTNASDGSTYLLSQPINPGTTWTHTFPDKARLNYYDFDRLSIAGQLIITRTTAVSVSCIPGSVGLGLATSCTATVTDTSPGIVNTPSGTVSFTTSGTGYFSPAASCTLSGTGATATCSASYTPTVLGTGTHDIGASYSGDSSHSPSSAPPFPLFALAVSVGGELIPVNKLALLAPYIGVASVVASVVILTGLYLKRVKSKRHKY